jgi:hypothetical protein
MLRGGRIAAAFAERNRRPDHRRRADLLPNLYAQTLKRAAQLLGGRDPLAARLHVLPAQLARWLDGVEPAPAHVFLKAVDLLNEQDSRSNLSR